MKRSTIHKWIDWLDTLVRLLNSVLVSDRLQFSKMLLPRLFMLYSQKWKKWIHFTYDFSYWDSFTKFFKPILFCNCSLQECIRNTKDGGKLGICLRNKRFANRDKFDERDQNVLLIDDIDEDAAKLELEVLKSTIVNNDNMAEIQNKLKLTYSYRMNLLQELEINLREYFPYFFVSADLVREREKFLFWIIEL